MGHTFEKAFRDQAGHGNEGSSWCTIFFTAIKKWARSHFSGNV
jgi:hypothetical protein